MKTGTMDWPGARLLLSPNPLRRKDWNQRWPGSRNIRSRAANDLLVVEDNPAEQLSIRELLGHDDIDVSIAATGAKRLRSLANKPSIASSSICACRICRASKFWSVCATRRS